MRTRTRILGVVVGLALGFGVTLHGQGPFTAQIEAFWRLISTGGRTFATLRATNVVVTGTCTGCAAVQGAVASNTLFGNPTAGSAVPVFTTNPTLGTVTASTFSGPAGSSGVMESAAGQNIQITAPGATQIQFIVNGTNWLSINSAGTFFPMTDATIALGGGSNRWTTASFSASVTAGSFQVATVPITSGTTFLTSGSGMAVANVGANSCGTTAATIAGNNNLLTVTVGATAGTQCRVTFTITAANAWGCTANDDTTTTAVRTTPVDTTHVDLIGAFVAGDNVTATCFAR